MSIPPITMMSSIFQRALVLGSLVIYVSLFAPRAEALGISNGNFADLTGLTDLGEGWYAGVPVGWSTSSPSGNGHAFSVRQIGTTNNYANLDVLGNVDGGFYPLRQNIGMVGAESAVTVTFKVTSLDGNPYKVASAIYSAANDTLLGLYSMPSTVSGNTTITYSVGGILPGTEVYVAFWATLPSYAPGITDVTVSAAASTASLTLASGSGLVIDAAAAPVSTASDIVFQPGSKLTVTGTPTGAAVGLVSTTGSVSGSPILDPALAGYELVSTDKLLWLRKGLAVYNGNFQNLTGLTDIGGGWYNGVPIGWTGNNSAYNVIDWSSGNFGANVQTLGPANPFAPFYQTGGFSDSTGSVRLSFNILGFSATYGMAAAIYNAPAGGSPATTWTVLATASYDETSGSLQTLEALNVPAGTPIAVAFWSWSGSPGIDNVVLASAAPSGLSYSPSSVNAAIGVTITPLGPPSVTGTVINYSISPALPTGLVIDASTGVISGTPSAASPSALYTVTASNASGSTTTQVTIGVAANAYNSWAAAYSLDPATNGAPSADPDGDGFLNSSEFAFGTNPAVGSPALVRTSTVSGQFVISWMQRIDSPSAYAVQQTANLATGPWASSPASVQPGSGSTPPAGYEWKQISAIPSGNMFYRIRASL